jgi:16S rRNA (adenine1518-N6/adenine1519-N6)-dimethyltransferase
MSAVVHITPKDAPADVKMSVLENLTGAAFGQRRKMLRRSLATMTTAEIFAQADVSPEARPEELDVHQWGRLATAIEENRRQSSVEK